MAPRKIAKFKIVRAPVAGKNQSTTPPLGYPVTIQHISTQDCIACNYCKGLHLYNSMHVSLEIPVFRQISAFRNTCTIGFSNSDASTTPPLGYPVTIQHISTQDCIACNYCKGLHLYNSMHVSLEIPVFRQISAFRNTCTIGFSNSDALSSHNSLILKKTMAEGKSNSIPKMKPTTC